MNDPGQERISRRVSLQHRLAQPHEGPAMDKIVKIVRMVAFLSSATVGAALFGGFSAWLMSQLDPAQQEIISLTYTRRVPNGQGPTVVRLEPTTVVGHPGQTDQPPTTVTSTH